MKESEGFNFDEVKFNYTNNVDIFAWHPSVNIPLICAIASEHGFRGITLPLSLIPSVSKELKKPLLSERKILVNALIDYPNGDASLEVRNFSIKTAKQDGADNVEICLPMIDIANKSISKINTDISSISANCKNLGLGLSYIVDCNNEYIDDTIKTKLSKIFHMNGINNILIKTNNNNISESILTLRHFRTKSSCKIKAYVTASRGEDISTFIKAGADITMLRWDIATKVVYDYESLIENET